MVSISTVVLILTVAQAAVIFWRLRNTRREDWRFVVPSTIIWISALNVTLWDFLKLQEMRFRFSVMSGMGIVLFLVDVAVARKGVATLGAYYSRSLTIKEGHRLVKHGIYGHVRHPIYLGAIMYVVAIPMLFSSMYGSAIMLGLIPSSIYRIVIEEAMLVDEFGDEYREYMNHTKKLIPFVY